MILLRPFQKMYKLGSLRFGVLAMLIFLLFSIFQLSTTAANMNVANQSVISCTGAALSSAVGVPLVCDSNLGIITMGSSAIPEDLQQFINKNNLKSSDYYNGGLLGMMAQAAYFSTSSSGNLGPQGVTYIAEKLAPNSAYAQSSALQGLSPVLVIHGIGRNLAYILIAIALVIVGVMTYFSKKSSKDSVPLIASISDIVMTMIIITISFPIGGIVVDLVINVGGFVIASLFEPFLNSNEILSNLYTSGSGVNIFSLLRDFQNAGSSPSLISLIQAGLNNLGVPLALTQDFLRLTIDQAVNGTAGTAGGNALQNPLGLIGFSGASIFTGLVQIIYAVATGLTISTVSQPLITAIIAFTIFIIIFRIIILLLGSFIGIILTIAFAPFILIAGAFPGVSAGQVFSSWVRRLIAMALIFPLTMGTIFLAAVFLNLHKGAATGACVYDSSAIQSVPITGNYPNGSGTASAPAQSFDTKRFQPTTTPNSEDPYAANRNCFPLLLPPQFNWMPLPLGNLGNAFSIDDFTRFAVGLALLIILPNLSKVIMDALKVKNPQIASIQDATAGVSFFSTFVGMVPVIGQPVARITSEVVKSIK